MASLAAEPIHVVAGPAARRRRARSPEVKALSALLCGAAACLGAGLLFPMTPEAPRTLGAGLFVLAIVLAVATWTLFDGHLPRRALLVETCVMCVLNSVLVARSATPGGAIADAFAYIWLTVYVAAFFPWAWWAYGVLVSATFGGGLLLTGLPNLFAVWLVLSVSVLMAGFVVSQVSRAMLGRMSTDDLTGALNRSGLQDATRKLRLRRRRDLEQIAVAALDLDGFKAVNDERGHATGDRLLAEASAAWRGALRSGDLLARTGGDEFIVVMPNTDPVDADRILARLRAAHPVAWSAGVAGWEADEPLATCLERADAALYAAKAAR